MLDDILRELVEHERSVAEHHEPRAFPRRICEGCGTCSTIAEYKRRQAPPGVKINGKKFRPGPPLSDHQRLSRPVMTNDDGSLADGAVRAVADRAASISAMPARRCSTGCSRCKHAGRFVLRFDDTDRDRSTDAFARAIAEDLRWLGIDPDLTCASRERFDLYAAAAERLKATRPPLSLLRDPEELESPAQAAAGARRAADLRPRGA